jgi:hypothetical protein
MQQRSLIVKNVCPDYLSVCRDELKTLIELKCCYNAWGSHRGDIRSASL